MSDKLLQVEHLKQYFPAGGMGKNRKFVKAVDDVSFFVNKGETLGLVGSKGRYAALSSEDADGIPGSLCKSGSQNDRRRYRRGSHRHP